LNEQPKESNREEHGSVTQWVHDLKLGDAESAQRILDRYMSRLIQVANRRLGKSRRRVADEDDVVSIAFTKFLERVDQGGFSQLDDRQDLWQILFTLTDRKAVDLIRRETAEKRGGEEVVVGEDAFDKKGEEPNSSPGINSLPGDEPTPEYTAILMEEFAARLSTLDNEQQGIAIDKMNGMTNKEISDNRKLSLRTIERRLQETRKLWRAS